MYVSKYLHGYIIVYLTANTNPLINLFEKCYGHKNNIATVNWYNII